MFPRRYGKHPTDNYDSFLWYAAYQVAQADGTSCRRFNTLETTSYYRTGDRRCAAAAAV